MPNFFQKPRNSHLGQFSTQSKTLVKSSHAQTSIDSDETKISELHKLADDSFSAFSDNPTTTKRKPKLAPTPPQPKLVRRSHLPMPHNDTPRPASRHSPEMTLARPRRAHKAHKKRIHKLRDTEVSIMTALEEIQFFNINNDDAIVNRSDARIRYANSHRMLNKVHHARSQITHGWQLAPEHSRYHHYHNIFNLHFRMIMREQRRLDKVIEKVEAYQESMQGIPSPPSPLRTGHFERNTPQQDAVTHGLRDIITSVNNELSSPMYSPTSPPSSSSVSSQ